jgi:CBS domain-containing protein
MKKQEYVAQIMTREVYTAGLNTSLFEIKDLFNHKKIRHLPIVNESGRLIGIISLTDILRLSFGNYFGEQEGADFAVLEMLTVQQVMRHHPHTVSSSDKILEAAKILAEEEFHALPVVDEGKLVGIITTTDIIKFLLTQINS